MGGFTLLELTIAMAFVAILVSGITLTISTSLKVWERSRDTADLNQEARAIIELLSRDIRGAYLGVSLKGGYFLAGGGATQHPATAPAAPTLEFTTESSAMTRAALRPLGPKQESDEIQQIGPPVSDYVAVRYEMREASATQRPGLYRTTWIAPSANWTEVEPPMSDAAAVEAISQSVTRIRFRYYDGNTDQWVDSWATSRESQRLPLAVAVELTLADARNSDHIFESVISLPAG